MAATVHIFSQLLCINADFKLSKLLEDVPTDAAADLARRVQKSAESFAKTFGPEEAGKKRRPTERAGDGEVLAP